MDDKKDGFDPNCSCKNVNCKRHGWCKECVTAHREKGNVPLCLKFEKEGA